MTEPTTREIVADYLAFMARYILAPEDAAVARELEEKLRG